MKNYRILDMLRRGRTDLENHLIDGLVDGRISRREFIRHGSLLGLSLPFLGSVSLATGVGGMPSLARAQGTPGATIRVASSVPAAAIEPVSVADGSAAALLDEAEDYLNSVGDRVRAEVDAERAASRRRGCRSRGARGGGTPPTWRKSRAGCRSASPFTPRSW